MKLHLAFTDDWEVRGNGSGDPRVLQFEPMRRMVAIFNRNGVRGSFNAEVMQQLTYREQQAHHPELKALADEWEEVVLESFRQGHDIQLHIHPQWRGATYTGSGRWLLTGNWALSSYSQSEAHDLVRAGRDYLESLLRKVKPEYRCLAFRAGAWCIAPSPHMLSTLAELGFVFDMSVVQGIHSDTRQLQVDYREVDEGFQPFYPMMTDARRLSGHVEKIVCVPTNTFYGGGVALLVRDAHKAVGVLRSRMTKSRSRGVSGDEWTERSESSRAAKLKALIKRYTVRAYSVSDLSRFNYRMLRSMFESVRYRAAQTGVSQVPIILTNHTKDVLDFRPIERFVAEVAAASDVQCVTLTEVAENLARGVYPVRRACH